MNAQHDIILSAVRIGFARAISQAGLTPSEAEQKIAALVKSGGAATDMLLLMKDSIAEYTLAAIAAGGIAGGISGLVRHNLDRRLDDKDDEEIQTANEKAKGYEAMSESLKLDNAASGIERKAPRINEAMR